LTLTASSGLPVTLRVDPSTTNGVCSLSGNTVSYQHAGYRSSTPINPAAIPMTPRPRSS
jgi:hypothetical protein